MWYPLHTTPRKFRRGWFLSFDANTTKKVVISRSVGWPDGQHILTGCEFNISDMPVTNRKYLYHALQNKMGTIFQQLCGFFRGISHPDTLNSDSCRHRPTQEGGRQTRRVIHLIIQSLRHIAPAKALNVVVRPRWRNLGLSLETTSEHSCNVG